MAHNLLKRQGLEIEESLHGDHHLFKILRNCMKQPLGYLLVADLLAENPELARNSVELEGKSSTDSPDLNASSLNLRLSRSAFASFT
jgi:hypothetical protein